MSVAFYSCSLAGPADETGPVLSIHVAISPQNQPSYNYGTSTPVKRFNEKVFITNGSRCKRCLDDDTPSIAGCRIRGAQGDFQT